MTSGIRVSRLDHLDLEQLKEVQLSPGWLIYQERIDAMIENERVHLESANPSDFVRVQGRIEALRRVKQLPGIIQAEIQNRSK